MQTIQSPALPRPAATDTQRSIACWNDVLTPKWVRFRHLLSGNGKIHSDLAYDHMDVKPGARVLDVGCGFGETCLELADKVGPDGSVVGLDCTATFLNIAETERAAANATNVTYREADIESCDLPAQSFDMVFSRFGIMFCYSPVRALRNIHRSMVDGGSLHLIAWRHIRDNPCWGAAEAIALRHLPSPSDEAESCGPGPFSFAGPETGRLKLEAAGFRDVVHRRFDVDVCAGRSVQEAVDYQLLVGPAGFVVRVAEQAGQRAADAIRADLATYFARHTRDDGSVWLASSTWLISARK